MRKFVLSVLFAGVAALMSGTAHAQTPACGTLGTEGRLEVVLLTDEPTQRLFCYIERTIFARSLGNIVGLDMGERLVGVDFRPANGSLYGVGTLSGVYRLDVVMGQVTAVKTGTLTTTDAMGMSQPVMLNGMNFGVDFNPVPDRLRVISDAGQNLRINVDGGATILDGTLTPAMGFTAVGYTNNDAAAATNTVLYSLNATQLNIQAPPNNGNQNPVGSTGITTDPITGFDVFTVLQGTAPMQSALRNRGIALLSVSAPVMMGMPPAPSVMNIYQINLETGAATILPIPGAPGFVVPLVGLAIPLAQTGTVVF